MSTAKQPDPYTVLGIDRSAGLADVKAAYRAAAKLYHPDLPGNSANPQNAQRWTELQDAYDLLLDPDKRAKYDKTGERDEGLYSDIQIEAIAAENVGKMIDNLIDTLFDVPGEYNIYLLDPLEQVTKKIREAMKEILADQRNTTRRKKLYERMRLVIKRREPLLPGEVDPVLQVLDLKIEEIQKNLVLLTNKERVHSRMSAIVRDYEFSPQSSDDRQLAARAKLLAARTPDPEPEEQTDAVIDPDAPGYMLRWTGRNGREGWWLNHQEEWMMVHGPSICVTSGGGPSRALATAHNHYPECRVVGVEVPPYHQIASGGTTCEECARAAARLTAEIISAGDEILS